MKTTLEYLIANSVYRVIVAVNPKDFVTLYQRVKKVEIVTGTGVDKKA